MIYLDHDVSEVWTIQNILPTCIPGSTRPVVIPLGLSGTSDATDSRKKLPIASSATWSNPSWWWWWWWWYRRYARTSTQEVTRQASVRHDDTRIDSSVSPRRLIRSHSSLLGLYELVPKGLIVNKTENGHSRKLSILIILMG